MNAERLLKLAAHLESGKLGHRVFDFSKYNSNDSGTPGGCGTAGCALGECPILWPLEWAFHPVNNKPSLTGFRLESGPTTSASIFFDIPIEAFFHLFVPWSQKVQMYGGQVLGPNASAAAVAANIRAFVTHQSSPAVA